MALKPREEILILDYPVQLADRLLEEVTMKRPTMGVLKKHKVKGSDDVDGELKLFAVLTGLRVEELEGMDAADYARLQDMYVRFRTPAGRGGDAADGAAALPGDTVEP